ncbi:hypothetical protein [Streptomyces sp. NPDC004976]
MEGPGGPGAGGQQRPTRALRGHTGDVWGVAWVPDGSRLATASHDRTVIVWEAAGCGLPVTLTGTLPGHRGAGRVPGEHFSGDYAED